MAIISKAYKVLITKKNLLFRQNNIIETNNVHQTNQSIFFCKIKYKNKLNSFIIINLLILVIIQNTIIIC